MVFSSDSQSIRIVFSNLINNAIKFTSEKGSVFVSSKSDERDIIISVSDTGVGMNLKISSAYFRQTITFLRLVQMMKRGLA